MAWLQAASDIFLGWHRGTATGDPFYWRQLSEMKGSFDTENAGKERLCSLRSDLRGRLARAHGRSGDAAMTSGNAGNGAALAKAIADFALAYADQTERDHQALMKAVESGRVAAEA